MEADKRIMCNNSMIIHLRNSKPVELSDFAISLFALNNQFKDFATNNGSNDEQCHSELYISKITEGSIIVELVEYTSVALLPIITENSDLIISFAKLLKSFFDYYINHEGEKPILSKNGCKNMHDFVQPIIDDNNGSIEITTKDNQTQTNYNCVVINAPSAQLLQNLMKSENEKLNELQSNEIVYNRQIMKLYQIRKDDKYGKGTKAKIDALGYKYLNVVFGDDDIKKEMLETEENPLQTAFVVDVIIQTVQDKPIAYKIIKIHDHFPIE